MNFLRKLIIIVCLFSPVAAFASSAISEDKLKGLQLVSESKHLAIYVKPGTDLNQYQFLDVKDATATVDESWLERYNKERKSLSLRLTEQEIAKLTERYAKHFNKVARRTLENESSLGLAPEANKKGLKVVPRITHLQITAPDMMTSPPSSHYVRQAGKAVLDTALYDAESGELVAVIKEQRKTRDHIEMFRTNRAFNQSEFIPVYRRWVKNWLVALEQKS